MKKDKIKTVIFAVVGAGLVLLVSLFVVSSITIGQGVKSRCEKAQQKFQGSCVDALIQVVDDEHSSLEQRKEAVWALGQLGEEKALAVLEKHFEGSEAQCDHDTKMCQYELSKAINLIKGGFNPTKLLWCSKCEK